MTGCQVETTCKASRTPGSLPAARGMALGGAGSLQARLQAPPAGAARLALACP